MRTLFATSVANAKPGEKDYKLADGAGLYLLVRPNGSKLWRSNYKHHGKNRMLAFGAWPEVSLADARGRRDEARRLIAAGLDPSHEQKVAAAKARVEENDTFKAVAKETRPGGRPDHRRVEGGGVQGIADLLFDVMGKPREDTTAIFHEHEIEDLGQGGLPLVTASNRRFPFKQETGRGTG